jgi:hypothetical protein
LESETGVSFKDGISEFYNASIWNDGSVFAMVIDKNLKAVKNFFKKKSFYRVETYKGKEIFESKMDTELKFYFPGDSLLLISTNKTFFDKIISGKYESLNSNEKFLKLIEGIKTKDEYWMATNEENYIKPLMAKMIGKINEPAVNDLIKSVNSITLAAGFNNDVELESNWGCSDQRKAFLLSTAIKGALAMNLLSNGDPEISETLEKIEVDRNKSEINFQLILNAKDLEGLKNFALKRNLNKNL